MFFGEFEYVAKPQPLGPEPEPPQPPIQLYGTPKSQQQQPSQGNGSNAPSIVESITVRNPEV